MRRMVAIATVVLLASAGGVVSAQEQRPAPGPGGMTGPGGGMMGPGMMGGGMMGGGMMGGGMMGPGMMGMGRRDHLEQLMVHDPKAAARIMRFRADMLRAISEVLQKHAGELDRAQ